jgi:ketosteroid isomerase-like protein
MGCGAGSAHIPLSCRVKSCDNRRNGEEGMTDRTDVEKLLTDVYAARKRGDLDAVCACFADNPSFTMAGAREASPIAVQCTDGTTFRTVMSGMIATFEWLDQQILAMIIDGPTAAVHWRGRIRSAITGDEVVTELVDVIMVKGGKIQSLIEFADTALAAKLMVADATSSEAALA